MQLRFSLLTLAEKKRVGATSIFSNLSDQGKFFMKCLISKKQCGFSFAQNHKSQSSTHHIWEPGKLYTIIEIIFF